MKKFYIVVTVEENEKFYSYMVETTKSENLASVLGRIENLKSANIYPKKKAEELVNFWNQCYKENGTDLFDEPLF